LVLHPIQQKVVPDCINIHFNLKKNTFFSLFSRRDDDERRLHDLASKTKAILKDLADEMTRRKKELSRVI
jgi:hypothetical protein